MLTVAPVELGPDHGQVHGPLDDLVVMTGLREKHVVRSGEGVRASKTPAPSVCSSPVD